MTRAGRVGKNRRVTGVQRLEVDPGPAAGRQHRTRARIGKRLLVLIYRRAGTTPSGELLA
jgi:hypothetical protein